MDRGSFDRAYVQLPERSGATTGPEILARLRELRLWHWNEAMRWRKSAEKFDRTLYPSERPDPRVTRQSKLADQHIKFVQTLNDFFPSGDTAEKDAANG